MSSSLKISEIFYSIQGEGPFSGYPTLFIRLFGCNLNCSWCDTPQAKPPFSHKEFAVNDLVKLWKENFCSIPFVTITGGEPLLQKTGVVELAESLLSLGAIVELETNGSLSLEGLPKELVKVVDVKTPSSGMEVFNRLENLKYLNNKDVIKFVIKDEKDFEFSLNLVEKLKIYEKVQVFFSPVHGELSPKILAGWILKSRLPIRLQVQLHKFLGLP